MGVVLSWSALNDWWCQNERKKSVPPHTFEHFTSISSFSNVIPRLSKTWAFYIGILVQIQKHQWPLFITWLSFFLWIIPRPSCAKTKDGKTSKNKEIDRVEDTEGLPDFCLNAIFVNFPGKMESMSKTRRRFLSFSKLVENVWLVRIPCHQG